MERCGTPRCLPWPRGGGDKSRSRRRALSSFPGRAVEMYINSSVRGTIVNLENKMAACSREGALRCLER
jgi:hypothetical protein